MISTDCDYLQELKHRSYENVVHVVLKKKSHNQQRFQRKSSYFNMKIGTRRSKKLILIGSLAFIVTCVAYVLSTKELLSKRILAFADAI